MSFFNRIRPDPGFVSPVRSDPAGFVSPIRSDPVRSGPVRSGPVRSGPVRSDPGFVNGRFRKSLFFSCFFGTRLWQSVTINMLIGDRLSNQKQN